MSSGPILVNYFELSGGSKENDALRLRDFIGTEPQDHEEDIARYLENAPSYSGMGTIVGDVLNASKRIVLFPGKRTDGVFIWQAELPYYVRTYHVRIPRNLVERMESLNWQPPEERQIDWQFLGYSEL